VGTGVAVAVAVCVGVGYRVRVGVGTKVGGCEVSVSGVKVGRSGDAAGLDTQATTEYSTITMRV
jgi:hypothetical protein